MAGDRARAGCVRVAAMAAAIAAAVGRPAAAQDERWFLHDNPRREAIALDLTWIDDVDGDGLRDVASGSRSLLGYDPGTPALEDLVRIRSSKDLHTIRELHGGPSSSFGVSLVNVGDHDGDGIRELAVAEVEGKDGTGRVTVWSPMTGELLRTYDVAEATDWTGVWIDALEDVDGDGLDEMVVGLPLYPVAGAVSGSVRVFGSAAGDVLAEWFATTGVIGGAYSFACSHDLDGDGVHDLVISEATVVAGGDDLLDLRVWSGSDFQAGVSRTIAVKGGSPNALVATNADMDGDGRDDLVIAINAYVDYLSGIDLATFKHFFPNVAGSPAAVAGVGDVDADGRGDVIVACRTKYVDDTWTAGLAVYDANGTVRLTWKKSGQLYIGEHYWMVAGRGGRADHDRDGKDDVVFALTTDDVSLDWELQQVEIASAVPHKTLVRRFVDDEWLWFSGHYLHDDIDGDGLAESLTREDQVVPVDCVVDFLSLRDGRDGAPIWRVELGPGVIDGWWNDGSPLVSSIPDVDGDAISDVALPGSTAPDYDGVLDLRSGATGSRIATLDFLDEWNGFPSSVSALSSTPAASDGSFRIAVGRPHFDPDFTVYGRGIVHVLSMPSGTELWSRMGDGIHLVFGTAVAFVGDVDGDGVEDLAAASLCLGYLLSGADGTTIATFASPGGDGFGARRGLLFAPDRDGDGISRLIVVSPGFDPSVSWTELPSLTAGPAVRPGGIGYESALALLPDANHDRVDELLVPVTRRPYRGIVLAVDTLAESGRLFSSATGSLELATRDAALPDPASPRAPLEVAVRDGRSFGVSRVFFPDLLLAVDPLEADEGDTVTASVGGGKPGQLVGLYIPSIDDLPFEQFLSFGLIDGAGKFEFSDVIPPGLAGTRWTVRAFTVGFDGRLARSNHEVLEIE